MTFSLTVTDPVLGNIGSPEWHSMDELDVKQALDSLMLGQHADVLLEVATQCGSVDTTVHGTRITIITEALNAR